MFLSQLDTLQAAWETLTLKNTCFQTFFGFEPDGHTPDCMGYGDLEKVYFIHIKVVFEPDGHTQGCMVYVGDLEKVFFRSKNDFLA